MCIIVYNKKQGGEDYMNLAYKILNAHLKKGELVPGTSICIGIDQTLTQDSTGTMAYLQLEAMNVGHVAVEKAVAYIDHNSFRLVLKTWMTMNLLNLLQENMVSHSLNQVMVSVISYNLKISHIQVRRLLVQILIHQHVVQWV